MNFKEKKIAYERLLSPTQAKHDIELLKKVFKDESKIITFARDPIRYAGDILYALLEHKTPEQIVQNRRKKQADADKAADQAAADKVAADKIAADQAAADKVAADQAVADKAAADKIAADQAATDKASADKIAVDQAAADKAVDQTVDEAIAQEHNAEESTEQIVTEAAVSVKDEEKKSE